MSDNTTPETPVEDVEAHGANFRVLAADVTDDVEGHRVGRVDGADDDVEGHGIKHLDGGEDDVEGHGMRGN